MSCNASKGAKALQEWLQSNYCKRKGISEGTVAEVLRNALKDLEATADATIEILSVASESWIDELKLH